MQAIVYPLYDRNKELALNLFTNVAECMNAAESGTFLLGKNNHWHGGIHLAHPSGDTFSDIVVQSIARGRVVAYRFHEEWEKEEYSGKDHKYSRNFVLIEHDLEMPYYTSSSQSINIFTGYKFFSLYMHLAPIKVLQEKKALPWFLATTRKDLAPEKVIARGSRVKLLSKEGHAAMNSDTPRTLALNGLVYVEFITATDAPNKAWLPVGMIAYDKVGAHYVTAQPIKYYYTENKEKLEGSILNSIKVCQIPVYVDAGDTLGMAGGTIIQDGFKDKLIHFEIFSAENEFMDYPKTGAEEGYTTNYSLKRLYDSQGISDKEPFAAGRYYYKPAVTSKSGSERGWKEYYFIGGDSEIVNKTDASGKHYLLEKLGWSVTRTEVDIKTTPVLEIVSDAQWRKGPHAWKEVNGSDFLKEDGFWNRCVIPEESLQVMVKQPSEWLKRGVKKRFESFKEKMGARYEKFISHIEGHCFWQEVSALGYLVSNAEVWHFHPIGFIEQLRRLLTPYHTADGMKLKRYLERHCNESLRYLKTRLQELQAWKAAGLPESQDAKLNPKYHGIAKSFYTWFGYPYSSGMTIHPSYDNNQDDSSSETKLVLPMVSTLQEAVNKVIGITERSLYAFEKEIDSSKMVHGFSAEIFTHYAAYVSAWDDGKHIRLCKDFINEPEKIDNSQKLCEVKRKYHPPGPQTIETSRGPVTIDVKEGFYSVESVNNLLNLMVHECSHFYDIGQIGAASDKRGLYDLKVVDSVSKYEFGPYDEGPCKNIAKRNPQAALCNADNYALFITESTSYEDEDTFSYF